MIIVLGFVAGSSLFAQTTARPSFEVASVKPLPPLKDMVQDLISGKLNIQKLGMTIDASRVDIGAMTLKELIQKAYDLKPYQIAGPDWMGGQLFEIHAKIPEGGSKEQIPAMLQTLLEERFKITARRENKEQPVYALLVSGDGLKLKEAVADPNPPAAADAPANTAPSAKGEIVMGGGESQVKIKPDKGGMSISTPEIGNMRVNVTANGIIYEFANIKMPQLCTALSAYVDRPVVDRTELKGAYAISLELSQEEVLSMAQKQLPNLGINLPAGALGSSDTGLGPSGIGASAPIGSGMLKSIEKIGLKLDPQKAPVETLIIDHIEKIPTED
jgi:uncharacterized protein (TIGR03435 family)